MYSKGNRLKVEFTAEVICQTGSTEGLWVTVRNPDSENTTFTFRANSENVKVTSLKKLPEYWPPKEGDLWTSGLVHWMPVKSEAGLLMKPDAGDDVLTLEKFLKDFPTVSLLFRRFWG